MSQISWEIVEQIAQGKLGRVMAVCPMCSAQRRTEKRTSKVLAVALVEPEFAVYYCNHCGANGYVHPDTRSKPVDHTELQHRREQADRTRAEKAKANAASLEVVGWGTNCSAAAWPKPISIRYAE